MVRDINCIRSRFILQSVLLYLYGDTSVEIAQLFGLTPKTIQTYICACNDKGLNCLRDDRSGNLLQNHPNKTIYLLLDNSKMHTCNKMQQTFRKYKHQLYPIYFLKYAPDLNPQENIRCYVKGRLIRGNAYGSNDEVINNIDMITDYLNGNPDKVQTITKVSSYF